MLDCGAGAVVEAGGVVALGVAEDGAGVVCVVLVWSGVVLVVLVVDVVDVVPVVSVVLVVDVVDPLLWWRLWPPKSVVALEPWRPSESPESSSGTV